MKKTGFIKKFMYMLLVAVVSGSTAFSYCLPVLADNDDEYVVLTDPEIAQAYQYWSLYGLTPDLSTTYTQSYSTSGSYTANMSFTLSGGGGIAYDEHHDGGFRGVMKWIVDTHYMHLGSMKVDPQNGTSGNNDITLSCKYKEPANTGAQGTITCTGSAENGNNVGFDIYNNPDGTLGYTYYDPYEIVTDFGESQSGEGDSSTSAVWTYDDVRGVGTLTLNGEGSLSGNGTITLNTTTTNKNNLKYVLPLVKGTYQKPTTVTGGSRASFWALRDRPFVIAFMTPSTYDLPASYLTLEPYDQTDDPSQPAIGIGNMFNRVNSPIAIGGYYLRVFELKTDNDSNAVYNNRYKIAYGFPSNITTLGFIPLYVGYKNNMSDGMYRFLYGGDRVIDAINDQGNAIQSLLSNGTSQSQTIANGLSQQNTPLKQNVTQINQLEDNAVTDMDSALTNIPTTGGLTSMQKFIYAANWVRTQYNRLVNNTPFEAVITFCLVFGIGLLLLGKIR